MPGQRFRRTRSLKEDSQKGFPHTGGETGGARRRGGELRILLAIATQPALLRDTLSRLINDQPDLEVVGAGAGEEEIVPLLTGSPAVIQLLLFDCEALGPNSESIIARLHRLAPRVRILVMATRSGDEYVERVLRAGACGLVGKQLDFETLLRAIRAVAAGQIWANRRATALTLERLTDFSGAAPPREGSLTRREQQIVDGVVRGLRNKEIARELNISDKTVKSHLNSIFLKLGLEGRVALALFERGESQPRA
jgi:DNA-binding NarL/FixJ family response regulator